MQQVKYIFLDETESTNNYANRLILSVPAEEGTVVLAQYQSKGKGQGTNTWESQPGRNLLMSLVLAPVFLDAGKQFLVSKVVSLAIVDFLRAEVKNVSIKWPNDIYVGDKKIAGILIENSVKGRTLYATVAGIGLNLNQEQFFSDAPNPVSLRQLTGKEYKIETVAQSIVENVFNWYGRLKAGGWENIDKTYMNNLYRNKGWWKFREDDGIFEARISGIGEFGQLMLEHRTGELLEYMFKEVEFVL